MSEFSSTYWSLEEETQLADFDQSDSIYKKAEAYLDKQIKNKNTKIENVPKEYINKWFISFYRNKKSKFTSDHAKYFAEILPYCDNILIFDLINHDISPDCIHALKNKIHINAVNRFGDNALFIIDDIDKLIKYINSPLNFDLDHINKHTERSLLANFYLRCDLRPVHDVNLPPPTERSKHQQNKFAKLIDILKMKKYKFNVVGNKKLLHTAFSRGIYPHLLLSDNDIDITLDTEWLNYIFHNGYVSLEFSVSTNTYDCDKLRMIREYYLCYKNWKLIFARNDAEKLLSGFFDHSDDPNLENTLMTFIRFAQHFSNLYGNLTFIKEMILYQDSEQNTFVHKIAKSRMKTLLRYVSRAFPKITVGKNKDGKSILDLYNNANIKDVLKNMSLHEKENDAIF